MLTLKLINEETERVIAGLEKKRFKGAREAIEQVLAVDKKRREAQQELDKSLNSQKQLSGQIGKCMKEGKKDEAEQIKQQVSALEGDLEAAGGADGEGSGRDDRHALPDTQYPLRRSATGKCR